MAVMDFREENKVKWFGVRPAHKGTQVLENDEATNQTTTIYTVPVGSVFFWTSYIFSHYGAANTYVGMYVYDATPAVWKTLIVQYNRGSVNERIVTGNFWPPVELPAGYSVRAFSGAAGVTAQVSVHGWVE